MITVNLKGGLGNQMFQYACARALALRNEDNLQLVRDRHKDDIERPFSLINFQITGTMVSANKVAAWPKCKTWFTQKILRQFYVRFEPAILSRRGDVYLDGYFQSQMYFADYTDVIRDDFRLKDALEGMVATMAEQIKNDSKAVVLHIRRGDYVTHPEFGGVVDQAYYQRAMAEVKKRIPKARFYVFSDDIAWCKANLLLPEDSIFVSQAEMCDYEELTLMSLAKHQIIANSSFSWWGAWLNSNPNKVVITPARWANGKKEKDFRDIIPKTWIRL